MSEKFDELVDRFGSSCEVFAGMRLAGDMVGTPANEDANRLAANSQKEKTRAALVEYVTGLEEEVERLRENVTAFASQLQAWGYGDASRELLDEVLCGKVNAPDYYALQDRLVACEASLVGMVQQYCGYRDDINPDATYHHDFVSAGENAFRYLLAHHIATLADNGVDIRFPEVE